MHSDTQLIHFPPKALTICLQGSESADLAEVESRVLALLQAREQEWNRRIHEVVIPSSRAPATWFMRIVQVERAASSSNQAGCNAMDVMCYNQLLYEMGCMLDELTGGDCESKVAQYK